MFKFIVDPAMCPTSHLIPPAAEQNLCGGVGPDPALPFWMKLDRVEPEVKGVMCVSGWMNVFNVWFWARVRVMLEVRSDPPPPPGLLVLQRGLSHIPSQKDQLLVAVMVCAHHC